MLSSTNEKKRGPIEIVNRNRFNALVNGSSTLKFFKATVESNHSCLFPSTAISTGIQPIACLLVHSICIRYASHSFQSINLFISFADEVFGSITTIHHDGIVKHIPWTTLYIPWMMFTIKPSNWECVDNICIMIAVSSEHPLVGYVEAK